MRKFTTFDKPMLCSLQQKLDLGLISLKEAKARLKINGFDFKGNTKSTWMKNVWAAYNFDVKGE